MALLLLNIRLLMTSGYIGSVVAKGPFLSETHHPTWKLGNGLGIPREAYSYRQRGYHQNLDVLLQCMPYLQKEAYIRLN